MRLCAVATVVVFLAACAATAPAGELDGVTSDALAPIDFGADFVVTDGPAVVGFDGPRAIVEFKTRVPTPPALVRYGPVVFDGGVRRAAYRKVGLEDVGGDSLVTSHRVLVDVSRLESPAYDLGLVTGGGGVVAYRVETYDPEWRESVVLDRVFRYRRSGPRRTGTYERAVTMVLGPFVDLVCESSFVVSWETDEPSSGAVVVDGRVFESADVSRTHEVLVDGLAPGTVYEYRIRYGPDEAETQPFAVRTASAVGRFRFAFASDSRGGAAGGESWVEGVNSEVLHSVLAGALTRGADFLLFGGDLVDGYTSSEALYLREIDSWKRVVSSVAFSLPIYEGVGNHEQIGDYFEAPEPEYPGKRLILFRDRSGSSSAEAIFSQEFVNPTGSCYGGLPGPESRRVRGGRAVGPGYGETVYSFNYGNAHFVSVNTNYWFTGIMYGAGTVRYPSDKEGTALALRLLGGNREGYILPDQLEWLRQDLSAAAADTSIDHVFIFGHEPAFPNGGHLYDAMFWGEAGRGGDGGLNDRGMPLGDVVDMRNRFWRTVSGCEKVVAVLFGDEHNYSRTLIDSRVDTSFAHPVWQIVSGGAGAPFYAQDTSAPWIGNVAAFSTSNHFCLFEVDGDRVGLSVYATSGVEIDSVHDLIRETREAVTR